MPSSTTRHTSPPVNTATPAGVNGTARRPSVRKMERFFLLVLSCLSVSRVTADSLSPPVNVTINAVKANSAVVTWDIPEGDPVIGFAITQQKKDVRMLRFIQEVNTTTRSCALWDLEEETDYIVHVQSISMFHSFYVHLQGRFLKVCRYDSLTARAQYAEINRSAS
ncbi:Fibronectin type III domain-containing protein 5 [Larimichthys crocea]|uniref:Uncharacterized protein n=1 Tax=Larimichthys crocea TaxID=215358 RepID=A0ACD3RPW8_LARCR|nr:Fibronectin type III domain-containing protein 5 [Larimichthys crocea]